MTASLLEVPPCLRGLSHMSAVLRSNKMCTFGFGDMVFEYLLSLNYCLDKFSQHDGVTPLLGSMLPQLLGDVAIELIRTTSFGTDTVQSLVRFILLQQGCLRIS